MARTPTNGIFQIRKWIHGDPANLENVCFCISDNFVTFWEQPGRTSTSAVWAYGIVLCTGVETDAGFTECGYLQSGLTGN
jgi:hypothetical protein